MLKRTAFSSWKPQRKPQQMSKTYSTKLVSHSFIKKAISNNLLFSIKSLFTYVPLVQTTLQRKGYHVYSQQKTRQEWFSQAGQGLRQ